ncbi:MAG: S8 family peptidase [Proteobacteria bacterium]|nr:S8 family peptidase [Pseudomonadota bacterium]
MPNSRPFIRVAFAACCAALIASQTYAGGRTIDPDQPLPRLPVTRLIIKASDKSGPELSATEASSRVAAIASAVGQPMTFSHIAGLGAMIARLDTPMSPAQAEQLARRIAQQPGIAYAEPDGRAFPLLVPNDARYASDQWDLKPQTSGSYGIDAQTAWNTTNGNGLRVAVLDTGIVTHTDLTGQTVGGYDFISDAAVANDGNGRDPDPSDPGDWVTFTESNTSGGSFEKCPVGNSSWHGTHVTGTIAALTNNSIGVAGIAYGAKVVPIRVLGKCGGFTSDIADAITWAAGGSITGVPPNTNVAKIISLSLGGQGPCNLTYANAIATARSLGALVVVAAGNDRSGAAGYAPANCPGVLTISATAQDGTRATYTNVGQPATLSAPGGDKAYDTAILSTLNTGTTSPVASPAGDTYVAYQGTSMATPHVSAVAALMWAVQPTLAPHHLAAFMRGSATPYSTGIGVTWDCDIVRCGDGVLHAARAVAAAQACTSPPTGKPAAIDISCNGDYDGNGIVDPLTDGLIATRLAMGFTGTAVTQNALGACATRTTYAALRLWSNRNCGTSY